MKIKSTTLIIIVLVLVLVSICGIVFFDSKKLVVGYNPEVDVQLNSKVFLYDYIDKIDNGEFASDNVEIMTDEVGSKNVKFLVKNSFGRVKYYKIKFNIVDSQAPVIECKKEFNVTKGNKINLMDGVSAADNSNENIEVIIEGDYNFNVVGSYTLYYVAKDSSGNEAREEFILTVNKKKTVVKKKTTTSEESSSVEPVVDVSQSEEVN